MKSVSRILYIHLTTECDSSKIVLVIAMFVKVHKLTCYFTHANLCSYIILAYETLEFDMKPHLRMERDQCN